MSFVFHLTPLPFLPQSCSPKSFCAELLKALSSITNSSKKLHCKTCFDKGGRSEWTDECTPAEWIYQGQLLNKVQPFWQSLSRWPEGKVWCLSFLVWVSCTWKQSGCRRNVGLVEALAVLLFYTNMRVKLYLTVLRLTCVKPLCSGVACYLLKCLKNVVKFPQVFLSGHVCMAYLGLMLLAGSLLTNDSFKK